MNKYVTIGIIGVAAAAGIVYLINNNSKKEEEKKNDGEKKEKVEEKQETKKVQIEEEKVTKKEKIAEKTSIKEPEIQFDILSPKPTKGSSIDISFYPSRTDSVELNRHNMEKSKSEIKEKINLDNIFREEVTNFFF